MIMTVFAASCASDYYDTCLPQVSANGNALQTALQIVFGILAAVAVLMIVIGGMRYAMSGGSPDATKQARGTIIYAVVGLVVALSAEVLVGFVLGKT